MVCILYIIFTTITASKEVKYADKEPLHQNFYVIAFDKEDSFFPLLLLSQVNSQQKNYRFTPSSFSKNTKDIKQWKNKEGTITLSYKVLGEITFSYKVLGEHEGGLIIKTEFKSDYSCLYSTYKLVGNEIVPIKSELSKNNDISFIKLVCLFVFTYFGLLFLFSPLLPKSLCGGLRVKPIFILFELVLYVLLFIL